MSTLQYRTNAATNSSFNTNINSCPSSQESTPHSLRSNSSNDSFRIISIPSGSTHSTSSTRSFPKLNNSRRKKNSSTNIFEGLLRAIRQMSSYVPDTNRLQSFSFKDQYAKVSVGFASISDSPPELWKAYLLKFFDSYAYFSFSLVFTLFLSNEFGMSDVQAGSIYGAWGALITVFGLFTGTVIDNLGVALCLRIGFVLSFGSRVTLFYCTSKSVLLVCVMVLLPFANCLGIPVLTVGIRRYTNEENRGFAFGLFYVIMNVGALIAGPMVDILTRYYNSKLGDDVGLDGNDDDNISSTSTWKMTTNRAIILSGVVANFFAICVAFSVREIKVDTHLNSIPVPTEENGQHDTSDVNNQTSSPGPKVAEFKPLKGSTWQILSDTFRTPNFRRYLFVCLLLLNVRMIFRHLDGTLPKYMMREFGADAPKGLVYSINPFMIIILVPIITAATTTVEPLVMIKYGTYISALSVFFLAFSTSLWACVMFVVCLSLGEALWSPRLYDYTMSVCQEGREGTYMALSSAPLFLAKLPVGFLSGLLLQKYCPAYVEEGDVRHSKTMWFIIGLISIVSPICITVFWGYISGGEYGRQKDENSSLSSGYQDEEQDTYQHHPLNTNISLPRVIREENELT